MHTDLLAAGLDSIVFLFEYPFEEERELPLLEEPEGFEEELEGFEGDDLHEL
jgi:hypothetical protein